MITEVTEVIKTPKTGKSTQRSWSKSPSILHHVVLIGCSKTKQTELFEGTERQMTGRYRCQQMYGGALFHKGVAYAEARGLLWYALSAKYGVWGKHTELKPYDYTFDDMVKAERLAWHTAVAHRLVEELWEPFHQHQKDEAIEPSQLVVEIHAGKDYCHPLAELLDLVGIRCILPLEGLEIGERLKWYKDQEIAQSEENASERQSPT